MNSVKDFRGKIEPPVERGVLKIERYAQRLTQGYSAHGGSYLWAPALGYFLKETENIFFVSLSSYRNTREGFGELEKTVETLACGSCSHSISRSPKPPLVFL